MLIITHAWERGGGIPFVAILDKLSNAMRRYNKSHLIMRLPLPSSSPSSSWQSSSSTTLPWRWRCIDGEQWVKRSCKLLRTLKAFWERNLGWDFSPMSGWHFELHFTKVTDLKKNALAYEAQTVWSSAVSKVTLLAFVVTPYVMTR